MKRTLVAIIFPILLLSTGVIGMHYLIFTDWFDLHQIWILTNFHWEIIFTAFIISSIYYFYDIYSEITSKLYLVLKNRTDFETKNELRNSLIENFFLQRIYKVENQFRIKDPYFKTSQTIFVNYNEVEFVVYLKPTIITFFVGNHILKKIEHYILVQTDV